jgi:ABC-type phosphate transport system substrate-binding protein
MKNTYHKTLFKLIIACVVSIVTFSHHSFAQVVVIAHKSTPIATLDNDKLLDIFTLNTKNWGDGGKITLLEIKGDSPSKARFYATLGTSFGEMQRLWLKKQFAGKGVPPTTVGSEDEIIQKVASTPGAIGYVSMEKASKDVKILATLR